MKLNQLSDHVYWLPPDASTDRPVLGVVVGRRGSLLVDAGNSPAHARLLLSEIERLGLASPRFAVLTHWHWDHVFGTAALALPTFASAETQRIVRHMAGLDWSDAALEARVAAGEEIEFCRDMIKAELPDRRGLVIVPPEIAFTGEVVLDLGGVHCQLIHVGGDHAADSVVVCVPEERALFLSDAISPNLYHRPPCYTRERVIALFDQLLACPADTYLAGHAPQPMSRADIADYGQQLRRAADVVQQHYPNKEASLAALEATVGRPLTADEREDIDLFLAGMGD